MMQYFIVYWITLTISTVFVNISTTSYKGFELLAIRATTTEQLDFFANLTQDFVELDVWQSPTLEEPGSLLVPPDILTDIKHKLDNCSISWNVSNSEIDQLIKESPSLVDDPKTRPEKTTTPGQAVNIIDHHNYHKLHAIEHYLMEFQTQYKGLAKVYDLWHVTYENRNVSMIRLSTNTSAPFNAKPSIIIEGGIHAREWIAPAAVLYVIEKMLKSYVRRRQPGLSMISKYDWYFVPVANPDGYEYTQTKRLWRKNRRRVSKGCIGIDVNRNFDIYFGTTGVSHDCNSEIYPGVDSFSEAESLNLKELFYDLQRSVVGYVSIHNFGQVLLVPWHYSRAAGKAPYFDEIYRVADQMQKSMARRYGTNYKAGLATSLMYEASGVSIDWALYQKASIYAISIELRPDYASFTLPESEIIPTGRELLAGLDTLSHEIR